MSSVRSRAGDEGLVERVIQPERRRVLDRLAAEGVDPRVLEALAAVPRHRFVPAKWRRKAWRDVALPIAGDQTISQPGVVARMTHLLAVEGDHKVLEIGTGSGYQTAILARLARWVFSLERVPELAREAIERMRELEVENVKIQIFDGTLGWGQAAPYDRILVTAGAPRVPEVLLEQLAPGGRLVLPEGDRSSQRLVVYDHGPEGPVRRPLEEAVSFVPLLGRAGWSDGER